MFSEDFNWHFTLWRLQISDSISNLIIRSFIWMFSDGIGRFIRQFSQLVVFFIIHKNSSLYYGINENAELVNVTFKGWKYIDVVPGYPAQQGDVGLVKVKFGPTVDWRREIFIPFKYYEIIIFSEVHHGIKTFQLGAYHIINFLLMVFQHVQDHGGNGGF